MVLPFDSAVYDPNGDIINLKRTGAGIIMKDLAYTYLQNLYENRIIG